MVGRRGTTLRSVIEHHELRVAVEQAVHLYIELFYALRLVARGGNGVVRRQNGEGIDQKLQVVVELLLDLFLRTVLLAEETGSFGYHLAVDAGSGRDHARWVPLHLQGEVLIAQLACLHISEVAVAQPCVVPFLQLAVEETLQAGVVHGVVLALAELLACQHFEGAQPVLIQVIGVHFLYAQGSIAVAAPSAAEVQLGVDAPYAVMA